ncbi:reverse transcriptase domain-containing protein [Tanacetum coccineum]
MSTRSSTYNLVPPFIDPESVIRARRRNLGDPSLLLDFEKINMNPNNVQGPPPAVLPPQNHNGSSRLNFQMPAPDLRTMEELCQPTMNGRGGPIAPVNIQATDFGLKNHMIQQEMASKFLSKYFPPSMVTKLRNDISNFRQLSDESLFEAWEPGGTFMKRRPKERYDLIENITAHDNDWDTSAQRGESSSSSTSCSEIATLAQQTVEIRKDMLQMFRSNQQVNYVTPSCETCGCPYSYYECQAVGGYTQDVYATTGNYNSSGNAYQPQGDPGPSVSLLPLSSSSKEVEREPETITDQIPISPSSSPFGLPKRNPHQPPIPYPSRFNKEKLQDKSDIQVHKFFQMFKKLHFNISLAEALALMPKYHKMLKDLLSDKQKLLGLANTSLTKNCSAVLLKKLLEKLRDPRKFLIPCDFHELDKCMALADLGASINLMPLSVWKKLMLPELVPTRITLELANRSIAYPAGIAKDVFVQVGKFTFPADFVVVDYDIDPRVPLILRRPFLRTARALVDVYGEELILRDNDEKMIFHADSTSKHPQKHGNDGSTTSPFDSSPSLTPFETSDSLLKEFTDELALLDPFPPGNEEDNFNPEVDLREIEYLLNQDPSTDSSPKTGIDIIDPILERFTDEPALVYSSPSGDDDDDDCRSLFLQNILDLYFKHFKLPEDVVNRILQVVLDLQHFKSSLCIFAATSSSAILCISTIDNFVHQIIKFQSILITSRFEKSLPRAVAQSPGL